METLTQDIRYGIRGLLKQPGFTLVAVITLALGIGANTAIFSVVNSVLLRPLPYAEPERLIRVWETNLAQGGTLEMTSLSNLVDWQRRNRSLADLAAWQRLTSLTLTSQTPALELRTSVVSANYFSLLGVPAAHGRTFVDEHGTAGHTRVAVISDELWRRQFGSNPQVSGSKIQLERKDFEIIGVMPRGFKSPAGEADLWVPMNLRPNDIDRGQTYLQVIGRLKSGGTLDQARSEMDRVASELAQEFPDSNRGRGIKLISLTEQTVGSVRRPLLIVMGAVGLVLLITCANVANLFLVKAAPRHLEIAIRSALGATSGRLVRQLVTEVSIVTLFGGALGLLIAILALQLVKTLNLGQLPLLDDIGINRATVLFVVAASLISGVLSGLVPSIIVCRPNLKTLNDRSSGTATSNWWRNRFRSTLVIAQVAMALVLLSGAGLLIRSFVLLMNVNPGFRKDDLLVARIALDEEYEKDNRQVSYFQSLTNRLKNLPGVIDAGAATVVPLNLFGIDFAVPYHRPDQAEPPQASAPKAKFRSVTPGYFRTMGIGLANGRDFVEQDSQASLKVVIINQLLAERAWPGENPVGKQIRFFWADWQTYEVIGVADNTKSYGLDEDWQPELFVPEAQIPYTVMNVVVRTSGDPKALVAGVRRTFLELDPHQPPHSIAVSGDLVSESIARERFAMTWLGALAAIALVLASVGIYGVISHVTTQRTREVGIRLALGAQRGDVLKLVVRNGMTLVLIGVGIGLACALALNPLIASLLFGVTPRDLTTLIGVSVLLSVIALVACYLPAHRATKVDPLQVLRYR